LNDRVNSAGTISTMANNAQTSYVVSVKMRPMDNAPIENRLEHKSAAKIEVGSVMSVDSEGDIEDLVRSKDQVGFTNEEIDMF